MRRHIRDVGYDEQTDERLGPSEINEEARDRLDAVEAQRHEAGNGHGIDCETIERADEAADDNDERERLGLLIVRRED